MKYALLIYADEKAWASVPHDVPFREDADQVLTVDHEGGADVLEAHHLGRLSDGRRGRDRDEIDAHELADGRHDRS